MKFTVITLFPESLVAVTDSGVTRRAIDRGLLQVDAVNPRDFTTDRHRTVDDRPFGGGPGMVMKVQPLLDAVTTARKQAPDARVIYLSPQGQPLNQEKVRELANCEALILVAGRYEGVDERFIEAVVDEEISIGDYVLSGGELAAMVIIDSVSRLVPGVLGHEASAEEDSFSSAAGLLDCPHYTRPEIFRDEKGEEKAVPSVLLSGDHQAIRQWRLKRAIARTWQRRPDLIRQARDQGRWSDEHETLFQEVVSETPEADW